MDGTNGPGKPAARAHWSVREAIGPALVLALGLVMIALRRTSFAVPEARVLLLAAVAVASLLAGFRSGAVAAVIATTFVAWSEVGRGPGASIVLHLLAILACPPIVAGFVRLLNRANEERAHALATTHVVEYYRDLLEELGAIVWELDLETRRPTFVSASSTTMIGYAPDDLVGSERLWMDMQHPDDLPATMAMFERLSRGSANEVTEARIVRPDGSVVWLQTAVRGGYGFGGHRVARGVALDITGHREAQNRLQETLSLLTATIESTGDGLLVVDLKGRITHFNRRFVEMWGLSEEVMRSGEDARAIHEAVRHLVDPEPFLAKVRELYADPTAVSVDELELTDGRVLERRSQPQLLDGRYIGRVWSFRDITERTLAERALRRSEDHLRHAQKMEAVGQLAGGIAHDFNNILTAVIGNLSLILDDPTTPERVRGRALQIQSAAERAATLTRQLLAFSRRQMLELKVIDLNDVIRGIEKLLGATLGDSVRVECALAEFCPVHVDPSQIEQVILNLAINARDAMPTGGALTIETRIVEGAGVAEAAAPLSGAAASGAVGVSLAAAATGGAPRRQVLLRVTDTGTGMDEATLSRIFEPFFTTKGRGKGTGLGLATAYGIVRQSGGTIFVESEPGRGTRFDIYLPFSDRPIDRDEAIAPPLTPLAGAGTVLVVEDEAPVRALMREALLRAGYRVLDAANGGDALEVADAFPRPLDLLVTDVVMPGMNGRELADRLRVSNPDLKLLFVSGYADDSIVHEGILDAGLTLLQKPFTMDVLVRRVHEAIEGRPGV